MSRGKVFILEVIKMNSTLTKSEISIVNYNKRGLFYMKTNKTEAMSCLLKAEMLLKSFPSSKLQYLTYNNLAILFDSEKDYSKAIFYLSQCTKLKNDDKSCKFFFIGSLINQSSIYSKLNRHEESISLAFRALNELENYGNPCLKVICLYTIALEYEYLQKISYSEKFYLECKESAKKLFDKENGIFNLVDRGLKNLQNRQDDPICILRDKTSKIKPRRGVDLRSRDTQKGEYYIKVDTTPWLEQEEWRLKSQSETPKIPQNFSLRKKYTRLSDDLNKSHALPVKLEDKLNYIGTKLTNLSGKLSDIEKLFKTDKVTKGVDLKKKAAITIQRAFRKYLKKKARKKTKLFPFFIFGIESKKQERFSQTSRRAPRNEKKFKGLIQSIVFIQKWIRGFLTRLKVKRMRMAAIKIQKNFRMYQVKKLFKGVIQAIVFIQQSYRSYSLKIKLSN